MPTALNQFLSQGLSTGAVRSAPTPTIPGNIGVSGNPAQVITDAVTGQQSTVTLAFTADLPKYYTTISISAYSKQDLLTAGKMDRRMTIRLPLPVNLNDYHTEEWREYEYGMVAGVASQIFGLQSTKGKWATGLIDVGATILAEGTGNPAASGAGTGAAGVGGYAANMFQTVLYRGPRFKQPKLAFRLAPKTFQEATAIRNIIHILNFSASPAMTWGNLFFDFPYIFEVAFWPNAGFLYKFKPAALEQIVVNYSGNGKHAFFHGEGGNNPPETVELELQFKELEYWIQTNWDVSNNPFTAAGGFNGDVAAIAQQTADMLAGARRAVSNFVGPLPPANVPTEPNPFGFG
jgi:hypothetical protein